MTSPQLRHPNRLLAALPGREFKRILPHFEVVELTRGDVLVEPGKPIRYAWFPHRGVISVVALMADGSEAETATIGCEGVVSFEFLTGGDIGLARAVVQVSGVASRIRAAAMRAGEQGGEAFSEIRARYARALFRQVMQSVACNGLHPVEERCCRWLLMAHDRAGSDTFDLTQEFLATMLGVRRPTVSVVARSLQRAGIIRYRRGSITVTDRRGLEDAACECYGAVRQHFERLLPATYAS